MNQRTKDYSLGRTEHSEAIVAATTATAFAQETAATAEAAATTAGDQENECGKTSTPECVHVQDERNILIADAVRKFKSFATEFVVDLSLGRVQQYLRDQCVEYPASSPAA